VGRTVGWSTLLTKEEDVALPRVSGNLLATVTILSKLAFFSLKRAWKIVQLDVNIEIHFGGLET
jgi:hypothetical protein